MMDKKQKQEIQKMIDKALGDFFLKNIQFRARKLGDTPTDSKQLSTNGNVTAQVQQAVANYLPLAGGNMNDGANIGTGSTNGTIIATAKSQLLGFHGQMATVQYVNTAGNSASASGTYGSTEQAMLNDAYKCLQSKGLLSSS